MRLPEIILVAVLLAAAVLQMIGPASSLTRSLTLLGLLIGAWQAIHDGTHWQIYPALAGLILLAVWQLLPKSLQNPNYQTIRTPIAVMVAGLAIITLGLMILFPMFTLPRPTGSYLVGTRILSLKDSSRIEDAVEQAGTSREVIVQVWYPADPSNKPLAAYERSSETSLASSYRSVLWTNSRMDAPVAKAGSPFPVLLFNHAWAGRRTQDTFLTEELASHGYVVASIDHPYNASRVELPGGRIISYDQGDDLLNPSMHSPKEIIETWNKELKKWVADEVFVLNTLQSYNLDQSSPWYGHLNTETAGAFGHSFGGAASIQICTIDPRIQSALNMDGWTFGDISLRAADQPTMFLYGFPENTQTPNPISMGSTERAEAELDSIDRREVDTNLKQYGGYKISVSNTSHMDFTDHPLVSPWRKWTQPAHIFPSRIQTIVRAYVLAFFDQTIRGIKSPLLQSGNSSPFHEVQMEQWPLKTRESIAIIPGPNSAR